jgi:aconitate hydratase
LKLICTIEPLIALPGPGDVVTVREVSGLTVNQVVLGSSANPGLRDFWIVSEIIKGDFPEISFDVNPSSRQVLENLMEMGFRPLIAGWTPSSIWLYGMHRHGTSSCHEHHQP